MGLRVFHLRNDVVVGTGFVLDQITELVVKGDGLQNDVGNVLAGF